jgi:hypothetical protein
MPHVWPYIVLTLVTTTAACVASAGQAVAPGTTSAPAPAPFADQLTGDWGGLRTWMAEHGVTLEIESLHFSQGLLAGTGRHTFAYGGRLDAFLQGDTGALGLWPGGILRTHLEYRYGELSPTLGGVALPTNVGVTLPAGTAWAVTSIHLAQRFGERAAPAGQDQHGRPATGRSLFRGGWHQPLPAPRLRRAAHRPDTRSHHGGHSERQDCPPHLDCDGLRSA